MSRTMRGYWNESDARKDNSTKRAEKELIAMALGEKRFFRSVGHALTSVMDERDWSRVRSVTVTSNKIYLHEVI